MPRYESTRCDDDADNLWVAIFQDTIRILRGPFPPPNSRQNNDNGDRVQESREIFKHKLQAN